ncbi:hypothetical protein WN944_018315 [Citrus x changshan-huyou]|uniref:Uncharacterized protein n=1 Tax=Citrus x changshan-huyou TaxID=2935761 RepID=A0AAP0LUI8_9ROSI
MATATTRSTSNTETKVKLKLMIEKPANKVLFAEAEKDFVDILFNLLYMPFGSVIRLLRNAGMVGCTGNPCQSLENLREALVIPNQNKVELLKALLKWEKESALLQPQACPQPMERKFYACQNSLLQGKLKDAIGALEERVVDIGTDEVLELLKASLQTNEALSTVFLPREERVLGMKIR